jgi:DNA sulfur modification protein DndD
MVYEANRETDSKGGVILRLEYIHLKNFRQYRDEKIDFSGWTPERNITVIQGAMGAGKTNILNAITWCFFGNEKHLTSKSSKGLGICNTAAANAIKKGNSCEVEVELGLIDNEGARIYIKRSRRFTKDYQGNIAPEPYLIQGEKIEYLLQVDREIGDETVREMTPTTFIQRLIPEEIAPYFFFDGDKLNEYFEERSKTMAYAVETISQIDLLDSVIRHLENTERDMERNVKDPTEEMKELTREREGFENKVTTNEKLIKKLKKEQEEMEDTIRTIDKYLGDSAAGVAREKSKLRERLERELAIKKDALKELERDRISVCIDWGAIALAYPALVRTVDLVKEAEHAGKLPAAYKKNFLERILKDESCICGCSLREGTEHRKEIEKLLQESDILSDLSEDLAHLSGRLREAIERFPQSYNRLVNLRKSIKQTRSDMDTLREEIVEVEKFLKDIDVEDVSRKETERQSLRSQSKTLERRIGILENDIVGWNRTISDLKNKISRAMGRDRKFKDDAKKRELCENAISIAKKVKEDVIEETRREIEALTKKYFLETHWKKGTYTDVSIDDNYSVSVKDNTGQESLGTLSRGETQVLAYAFVIALNIVSGFDFPLVIDTPFGRISSEPRIALGKALSTSLGERQLIFLMTDVEYTSDIQSVLCDSLLSEYRIAFTVEPDMIGGEAKLVIIDE